MLHGTYRAHRIEFVSFYSAVAFVCVKLGTLCPFFSVALRPYAGHGLLILEVF
jgi:hypothetical protein